jgi:hypothetical protein
VDLPSSLDAAAGSGATRVDYVFTGSTKPSKLLPATGLDGTGMVLNGQLLSVGATGDLPPLVGHRVAASSKLDLGPESIVYSVFENAKAAACTAAA